MTMAPILCVENMCQEKSTFGGIIISENIINILCQNMFVISRYFTNYYIYYIIFRKGDIIFVKLVVVIYRKTAKKRITNKLTNYHKKKQKIFQIFNLFFDVVGDHIKFTKFVKKRPTLKKKNVGKVGHFGNIYSKGTYFGTTPVYF